MKLASYVQGQWQAGQDDGATVLNAVTGEPVCQVSSAGVDFAGLLDYGRTTGGETLRALTIHDRANRLKAMAKYLMERKERYYEISAFTGATRADSWIDIEGGLGTFFAYSGVARREFGDEPFAVEGDPEMLSKHGTFIARHILVPKEGVSVHINAFNFPCWGMLEKIAPSLAAGMPVVVKPATSTAYLTEAMVRDMIASGIFPEGSIQLICGSVGDLFEHFTEQDCVTFTGSASTARKLRTHPNIIEHSVPFNAEADSLNCAILGPDAQPGSAEFDLFIKEVAREMTIKAGQKCTAIRRALVPADRIEEVGRALAQRLAKTTIGDPTRDDVRMGSLVSREQRADVQASIERLRASSELLFGGEAEFDVLGADRERGAFCQPTLLYCDKPFECTEPHEVEAFGPVSTVMPYANLDEAITLARRGRGSLVGSIFTGDDMIARTLVLGTAPSHGRLLVINEHCAGESTGHGSPLPQLVHGGPGRAGGGEELGGARAIKHYMQRTAVQGSPTTLTAITNEYHPNAATTSDAVHPFRKYFEDLEIGESLLTHRRTITEADIVNFGCLSGDHFYAHFDEIAAADSLFGKRVAHGYFVISAAAGMFVDPAPGPVLANYGMDNLRFVEPVGIGDTIRTRLTVKKKIRKDRRGDEKPNGVVVWKVEVTNQHDEAVALYDILTLVERRDE